MIFIFIMIILFFFLIFYLYFENTQLEVRNYKISGKKIPNDFNDYKIVQISDFHNTTSEKLRNSLINEIKNQKPNSIVLTGDLIDSRRTNIDAAIHFIKKIKDIAPIYFVSGNHEARIQNYHELKTKLANEDVILLNNKLETIRNHSSNINLLGIDDPGFKHKGSADVSTIIKNTINDIEYNKEIYTILLLHRPEMFDIYVKEKMDLVLTGHAHGGQIRLPFAGGIFAPRQGLFPKYTSGAFHKNHTTMIVSRGIGNSIFPFRINNRPELVVVTLQRESSYKSQISKS